MNAIEDAVGADNVIFEAKGDPGTTGRFEVTVGSTLVHSKATKGQGKCESAAEREVVIAAIKAAIA